MNELTSPHNNERCICSDSAQLENRAAADAKELLKQLTVDTANVLKYIGLAIGEFHSTNHYILNNPKLKAELLVITSRYLCDLDTMNTELLESISNEIVDNVTSNCPYCKF